MLTCKDICENATDYLEEPGGILARLQLRFHLLICKHCRRFMRQFRATVGVSAQLNEIPAPTDAEIDALVDQLAAHREQQDN